MIYLKINIKKIIFQFFKGNLKIPTPNIEYERINEDIGL